MSAHYPHPIIAREGWTFLALARRVAAVLSGWGLGLLALLAWVAVAFIPQFFRDPPRAIPQDAKTVLSPADGRIVMVGAARDPYLDRDALKISVFMNVFNVHSNRAPVDGAVASAGTTPAASSTRRSTRRRSRTSATRCSCAPASGQDVTCVQIAGLIARRILCYVEHRRDLRAASATGSSASARAWTSIVDPAAKAAGGGRRRRRRHRDHLGRVAPEGHASAMPTTTTQDRACSRTGCGGAGHLPPAQPVHDLPRCSPASTRSCRR